MIARAVLVAALAVAASRSDYWISFLLGVIEGLTEFLPVSSTAHLRIVQAFLGINLEEGYWKMYTIVIQLGAILSLPIYFRARIAGLLRTFPRGERGDRTLLSHPVTLTLLAFVFTAVPSLLLIKTIGENLESLYVMGGALVVGGVVMWVVDHLYGDASRTPAMDAMSTGQAIWIGLCQALAAVFPGASRSMATIAAGQVTGMSRPAALEFSFFLSMPTMFAATGYDLYKSLRPGGDNPIGATGIDAHGWIVLAIGFVTSFFVAYGVVAWFMAWVRTRGFVPFAIYRIVFGAAVLAWAFLGA
jgi:undecaprenyl-diphosphatase